MCYIGIRILNYSVGSNVGGELEAEIKVQKNEIDSWHITYYYFFRKSRFVRFSRSLLLCCYRYCGGWRMTMKKMKEYNIDRFVYSGHAIIIHTRIIQYYMTRCSDWQKTIHNDILFTFDHGLSGHVRHFHAECHLWTDVGWYSAVRTAGGREILQNNNTTTTAVGF